MSFRDAVLDALELPKAAEATSATHEVVAKTLGRIDPQLEIETTDFLVHSFIPDLVVSWGPKDDRKTRNVHLRFSVADEAFPADLAHLERTDAVFIGMTDDGADAPSANTDGSLVTQTPSVSSLEEVVSDDPRASTASQFVVRQGHGVLGLTRARALSEATKLALSVIDSGADSASLQGVEDALAAFDDLLPSESVTSIERSWQRIWILQGGDPSAFPGRSNWQPEHLSREELGEVLNALLDAQNPPEASAWQKCAGHLDIDELGRTIGRNRRGSALDSLALALLPGWSTRWAWGERIQDNDASAPGWLIDSERIGIQAAGLRVFFANDGRRNGDRRSEHPLPTLSQVSERLAGQTVEAVQLTSGDDYLVYGGQLTDLDDAADAPARGVDQATDAEHVRASDDPRSAIASISRLLGACQVG